MQLSPTAHAILILRSLVDVSAPFPSVADGWLLNAALRLEGRTPLLAADDLPVAAAPPLSPAAARLAVVSARRDTSRALWCGVRA